MAPRLIMSCSVDASHSVVHVGVFDRTGLAGGKALRKKVQSVVEVQSQLHKEVLDKVRVAEICQILPSASTSW